MNVSEDTGLPLTRGQKVVVFCVARCEQASSEDNIEKASSIKIPTNIKQISRRHSLLYTQLQIIVITGR